MGMGMEAQGRAVAFQRILKERKVAACVIENPVDLFYLTGLELSEGTLAATPNKTHLFVDGRYLEAAKEKASLPVSLQSLEKLQAFLKKEGAGRLSFDAYKTSYLRYKELKKRMVLHPWALPLKELRVIKDAGEIEALKKSARLLWQGVEEIRRSLRVGMGDREAARQFEIFCLKKGAERLGFSPIIAFGANSSMPHYRSAETRLKRGDAVLIDIGVVVDHYHSDMTRVLFLGPPKAKMRRLYEAVHAAQKEALKLCRPGVKVKEPDAAARRVFRKEKLLAYYPHSLGHGVGLEVHEPPRLHVKSQDKDLQLKPGMVFTVEPGLYLPSVGGVRYEDTVIITDAGYENLYPTVELGDAILQ